jgi:hypothetical protein
MQGIDMCASAQINEYTKISYLNCHDGTTEFAFDEATFVLGTNERGLHLLAEVVMRAVQARRESNRQK